MRPKLSLAGIFCLVSFFAFAQTVPFPTDTVYDNSIPFSEKMDDVFGNIDLTDVTTNLLLDRAWPFAKPADFDGTQGADTVKSHKHWLKLYGTMATAATSQPAPIPSINDWRAQRDAEEENGKNPLVIIHADYHRIKRDSALIYSLFYEQNGELYDAPNQSTSPYEAQTLFAFSPYKTTIYDSLSMDFKTSPAFFKTNTGLTVSTVEFDFDDGQGWRTVGVNATTKVSWSTFGKKQLKLRLTYTNNQVFYAYSTLNLVQSPHYNPTGAKNYSLFWNDSEIIEHPTLNDYDINLQIEYACGNDKILKPFIYVEGFSPDEYFESFNNETYSTFYNRFNIYQNNNQSGYPLLDELEANGYDIIYVDFEQGTGNILENAQTLKRAIKWVNDQKAANGSSEPNVVAGYSMGGLVARVAIRQMELEIGQTGSFGPPDVSYFITVDTPHLGANIPYAVAIAVDDFYRNVDGLGEYEESLENAYDLLNSPAAKQMLFYAFDIQYVQIPLFGNLPIRVPSQMRIDFVNELDALGLPQTTVENVAIAKGNGTGTSQGFTGVAELISVDVFSDYSCFDQLVDTYDLIDGKTFANSIINLTIGAFIDVATFLGASAGFELDINALPGGDEQFEIYGRRFQGQLLWGLISFDLDEYSVKAHGIPFDSAPGGTYDINAVSGSGASAQFYQDVLAGNYEPCLEIHETQFGFVPTVSALNISGMATTPFAQIDPIAIVANSETDFDKAFILDPALYPPNTAPTNEAHVDLTPSNVGPFEEFISVDFYPSAGISSLTSTTLNYGFNDSDPDDIVKTTDRILGSLTLEGTSTPGGVLCINCTGNLEIIDDVSFPVNTADTFEVKLLSDCSNNPGLLEIEANGVLRIGENGGKSGRFIAMNGSQVVLDAGLIEVRPNSELVINEGAELRLNGGTLRVMDGGKVTIKDGGLLRFEENASIELNGNDAELALSGLTYVGDNAIFGFTYQGTESGYIRLLKEGYWGERFAAGTNAEIYLRGEDHNDLVLLMEESTDLWEWNGDVENGDYSITSSVPFDKITFRDGKIQMEHDARINALDRAYFYDCKLHPTGGGTPRGVVPFNICLFQDCQVSVPIDAKLHFLNTGKLYIRSSEILSSVTVWGQGYQILDSSLDGGFWGSGLESVSSSLSNVILNSTFDNYRVYDQSFSNLNITKSTFINRDGSLADGAVIKEYGAINLRCSNFIDNKVGVVSSKLNMLSMSSIQNLGYNFFDENQTNIIFWDSKGINLYEGYNQIYDGSFMNFEGTLDKDFYTPIGTSVPNCPGPVNASKNIWTPYSGGPPFPTPGSPDPALFDVSIMSPNQGGNIIHCQISFATTDIGTIVPCGEFDRTGGPKSNGVSSAKNGSMSFPLVNSETYFTDTPFDEALFDASSTTRAADSLLGNDVEASSKFYELLTADLASVNDSIDSLVTFLRWSSIDQYKSIIEGMVTDSLIMRDDNTSGFEPTIQEYVNTLMHFTDSIKTEENYKTQFSIEMKKLSLFSLLGQDESALQIAVNLSYCDHDSLQQFVLEELINSIGYNINTRQQGYLTFLQDSITFELDSSIFDIPVESFVDSSGFGTYINGPNSLQFSACALAFKNKALNLSENEILVKLYPNPSSDYINVYVLNNTRAEKKVSYRFELMSLSGQRLISKSISTKATQIDVSDFASGMYLYRVYNQNSTFKEEGKLIIER